MIGLDWMTPIFSQLSCCLGSTLTGIQLEQSVQPHTHTQIWTVSLSASSPPSALFCPGRPAIGQSACPSPQQPGCRHTAVFSLNIHKGPSTQLDHSSHTHIWSTWLCVNTNLNRVGWPTEWRNHQTSTVWWRVLKQDIESLPTKTLPMCVSQNHQPTSSCI